MFHYKLISSPHQQEIESTINQLAENAGWRLRSLLPPARAKGPQSQWRATLERKLLRLTWTQNNETDLAGYKLYWSKTPQNGVARQWIVLAVVQKNVQSYDVPIALYAQPGIEYAFSVSAFDLAGNESKQTIIATVQR